MSAFAIVISVLTHRSLTDNGWVTPTAAALALVGLLTLAVAVRAAAARAGRRHLLPPVMAVVIAVLALTALVWGATSPLAQRGHAFLPAADADPQTVVVALLQAEHLHDHAAVAALHDPATARSDWWRDVRLVGRPAVTQETGLSPSRLGPDEVAAYVAVDVDVRLRSHDVWQDGRHAWGYTLARRGPGGAWRVVEEGID